VFGDEHGSTGYFLAGLPTTSAPAKTYLPNVILSQFARLVASVCPEWRPWLACTQPISSSGRP